MKRLILLLLLWLAAVTPSRGQSPQGGYAGLCDGFCTWLPVVISGGQCDEVSMSDWRIVIPEATTNKVLNPSGEAAGNYAAAAGTTVTFSTTYQHYGLYSYRVETSANNEGIQLTLSALANAIHYVTVRVRGTLPAAWDWSLDNGTYTAPTLIEQIDANWALYGLQFPAAQANGSTTLYIYQNGGGSGDFYLDGFQVEEKEYWTTYCDGTQEGCAWLGIAHATASERSAYSRAGGRLYDLESDYYLNIGGVAGGGAAPQKLGVDSYAILPGGELNSLKIQSRVFTLTGVISGTSQADFHSKQETLRAALVGEAFPENQPVRLRYHGTATHKEIAAYYDGGLEGEISASGPCAWEQVAVRFIAPDPYWREIGESAALLDTNDSATFTVVAGRLKSTGQWDNLGPPDAAGTYTSVRAIAEDATYVYIGGAFANFDNIANADNIVRYNKQTGAYSALDVGLNDTVSSLAVAPNGDLYIGGKFTNAGGVAQADSLARWDGTNFNAVGSPSLAAPSDVLALVFDRAGNLFIGGDFDNWGGVAAADNIAKWDGTNYTALSSGADDIVNALAIMSNNDLIAGGAFTVTPGAGVSRWDGSAWNDLGAGISGGGAPSAFALAVAPNDDLYIGGSFTSPALALVVWNGTSLAGLGNQPDNSVYSLAIDTASSLFLGGFFTSVGDLTLADRVARWNGYAFAHLDLDLPGTPIIYAILASDYVDPVIPQKYDLFLGFDTDGTGTYGGKVTPTNDGTVPAFPRISFTRSGGTSAIIETLRNETTGKELLLNYALLNGETLAIDLTPTQRSVTSSFFGPRPDAVLANSDVGTWVLQPGSNSVTSFVATAGSPTVTAWMSWKEGFASY